MKIKQLISIPLATMLFVVTVPPFTQTAYAEGAEQTTQVVAEDNEATLHYVIEKDALAPKPNPLHMGKIPSTEAKSLEGIIEYMEECGLLQGQELVFDSNANFYAGSDIRFYYDESILVICWQELINNSVLTFSEIKIADASQFRRKLAGETYGSGQLKYCTTMSQETNAVVAMNADFYGFRNLGVTCYDGTIYRTDQRLDTLFIDEEGDFILFPRGINVSGERLQKFVDDHKLQFSLAFGPTLVQDGNLVVNSSYPIGEINDCYARAAIAQVDKLHYLYANVSSYYGTYVTDINTFAGYVHSKGVKHAYTLDGGQTSELIFNQEIIHHVVYGRERTVSDMIYFATAIPNE